MGISGKHVLKAFGEYEDIKVRYVVPALPVLRGVLYLGKLAYPPVEAPFFASAQARRPASASQLPLDAVLPHPRPSRNSPPRSLS